MSSLLSSTVSSSAPLFQVVVGATFGKCLIVRGIQVDAEFNLFAEHDATPAITVTAKISGTGIIDINALRRILQGHELVHHASLDLVVIGSVCLSRSFASIPYPLPFQYGDESKVSSILGDKLPFGYYPWDTQAIVSRSAIEYSAKEEASHKNGGSNVTDIVTVPAESVHDMLEEHRSWQNSTSPTIATSICSSKLVGSRIVRFSCSI